VAKVSRSREQASAAPPALSVTQRTAAPPDVLRLADGHWLPLLGDDLQIGRGASNDIVLDDQMIASHHARLQRLPEGWLLTALTSRADTAVNGERLSHAVLLAPGDTLRLGRVEVTLQPAGAETNGHGPPALPGPATVLALAGAAPWGTPRRLGVILIHLHNVVKTYPTSAGPLTVLQEVSLGVQAGELVAIVGPSGCGKSTLLNVITGIDRPDAGEVVVGGQHVHRMRADALTRWRGRGVGIVFQFFQLLPTLTVAENVMLPMAFCGTYRGRQRRERALEVLGRVGIEHMADRLPSALSGGEQQRAAIARALANDPPILVADEPTGNLDGRTGRQIFELFADLVAGGTTVLMVTHDAALAGEAPRRIEMADGRIVGAA
jgi:putative ABC transport system ATP-binding protein